MGIYNPSTGGGGSTAFSGFSAYLSTNSSSAGETIIYDTALFNTGTQYNTTTGVWTIPTTGYYTVTMGFGYTSAPAGPNIWGLFNGTFVSIVGQGYSIGTFGTGEGNGYIGTNIFHLTSGATFQFIDGSGRAATWIGQNPLVSDGVHTSCFASVGYLGS